MSVRRFGEADPGNRIIGGAYAGENRKSSQLLRRKGSTVTIATPESEWPVRVSSRWSIPPCTRQQCRADHPRDRRRRRRTLPRLRTKAPRQAPSQRGRWAQHVVSVCQVRQLVESTIPPFSTRIARLASNRDGEADLPTRCRPHQSASRWRRSRRCTGESNKPRRGDRTGSPDRIATPAPRTAMQPHTREFPPEGRGFHRHRHVGTHKTHPQEGCDLNGSKEQQQERLPRHAPSLHRAKILAEAVNQQLSPHRQRP